MAESCLFIAMLTNRKSPDFVSRQEAAERLILTPRQIDRLAREGKLSKVKISASRSGFPRAAFEEFLATRPAAVLGMADAPPSDANFLGVLVATRKPKSDLLARTSSIGLHGMFVIGCDEPGSVLLAWHKEMGFTPAVVLDRLSREGLLPISAH